MRVDPSHLRGVDLAPILAPAIAIGDRRASNLLMRLPLSDADIQQLDAALLEGGANGDVSGWAVRRYLRATDRGKWPAGRALIEEGLGQNDKSAEAFGEALAHLSPDKDHVKQILATYRLPPETVKSIQRSCGIKEGQ